MIRALALSLAGLASLLPPSLAAAPCDGPILAVTPPTLRTVDHARYLNLYRVSVTVTNTGDEAQAANVLQFLDVLQYGGRLDDRGVPPLAPGQSYAITYTWPRSADAGPRTSPLEFRLRYVAPLPASACYSNKPWASITI